MESSDAELNLDRHFELLVVEVDADFDHLHAEVDDYLRELLRHRELRFVFVDVAEVFCQNLFHVQDFLVDVGRLEVLFALCVSESLLEAVFGGILRRCISFEETLDVLLQVHVEHDVRQQLRDRQVRYRRSRKPSADMR